MIPSRNMLAASPPKAKRRRFALAVLAVTLGAALWQYGRNLPEPAPTAGPIPASSDRERPSERDIPTAVARKALTEPAASPKPPLQVATQSAPSVASGERKFVATPCPDDVPAEGASCGIAKNAALACSYGSGASELLCTCSALAADPFDATWECRSGAELTEIAEREAALMTCPSAQPATGSACPRRMLCVFDLGHTECSCERGQWECGRRLAEVQ